ncbi:MAG TPA: hypothetical protein VM123_11560 [archaeon]|nr:hypothetical protein [archaeon]
MKRRNFMKSAAIGTAGVSLWNTATSPTDARAQVSGGKYYTFQNINRKWFLVSPEGKPAYLRGANHYGDGTHMPWNLKQRYGTVKAWRESVRDRHREWGFNYLPPSIGPSYIKPGPGDDPEKDIVARTPEWSAAHFAELEYPFTAFLEVPKQYMAGQDLPDVFSQEFRDMVDNRCREFVEPLRDNPYLIGYHFCHNPPWHPVVPSFIWWIENTVKKGQPGRKRWVLLMRQIYGSVDRWRKTYGMPIKSFDEILELSSPLRDYVSAVDGMRDQLAFMERICEEWYKVYSGTIRKYDQNHLLLGDRNTLHLHPLATHAVRRMQSYVDCICVNVMGNSDVAYKELEQVTPYWDGPIHLADTGANVYQGGKIKSGFTTGDYQEFEDLYQSLMQAGLDHPQIIGTGWCGYYESAGRGGIVHVEDDSPVTERVEVMKKWNFWMEEQYARKFRESVRLDKMG